MAARSFLSQIQPTAVQAVRGVRACADIDSWLELSQISPIQTALEFHAPMLRSHCNIGNKDCALSTSVATESVRSYARTGLLFQVNNVQRSLSCGYSEADAQ